jgi:aspartyl aminopeptidase
VADRAAADDLRAFSDASPTPFHAVAEMARRLEVAGFSALDERERWSLAAGDRRYVQRGGSIAAFQVGRQAPSDAGFRMIGAHTDSPTLKVRPRFDVRRAGYRLVGVEPYGGLLLHTWLDRDLTVAGRVAVREPGGGVGLRLVRLPGAPLRIPSLAIHLQRDTPQWELKLNPQTQAVPLWGPTAGAAGAGHDAVDASGFDLDSEPGLLEALAEALDVAPSEILGHDLVTADTLPAAAGGSGGAYVFAPRLDNQSSCHAAVTALAEAGQADATQVIVANDHEEVGSGSAEGARGPFLADALARVVTVLEPGDPQALPVALARSVLVSADAAHALHPNFAEQHEPAHTPRLGGGPILKVNANQSYATDAATGGWFAARCAEAGVPLQHFVTRADLPCGSTIGPLTAARLGVATVDVGMPVLSMHSCREQAAADDVGLFAAALRACLAA